MKILELNIIEFGGLKDRVIALSDGLNVLEGENEAGKSTVWLFIKFMLYGLPRKGQEERARSVSRLGHSAKGSMRLLFEGEEYVIERIFVEGARSGSEKLSVFRVSDGSPVFGGMEPGEAFWGVPKEVFESSCGIGQNRSDGFLSKKGLDAIRNLLSSADENTDIGKIEEKLDKIRVQYRHKTGKGGRLLELGERLSAEKLALSRAEECYGRISALEEKLVRNQKQEEEIGEKLKKLRELLSRIGKRDLLRRFEELGESEREYRTVSENLRDFCGSSLKGETLPAESDAARLVALADQLETAEERVREQKAEKARLRSETSYDDAEAEVGRRLAELGGLDPWKKRWSGLCRASKSLRFVGAIVLLLGAAVGVVSALLSAGLPMVLAESGVACFGLVLLLLGIGKKNQCRKMASAFGKSENEVLSYLTACDGAFREKKKNAEWILRADTELESAERMSEELARKIRSLLDASPMLKEETIVLSVVALARREAERMTAFLRSFGEYERKAQVLRQTLERDRAFLDAYDEETLRAEVPEEILQLTDEEIRRAETEQRFYSTQIESLRGVNRRDQVELISLRTNFEERMKIGDRIAVVDEEYARAREYSEAVNLALEGIRNAAKTMSGSVTPVLSREAGSMMAYLSDGRYSSLYTGNDLTPSLVGENGLRVDSELLSGGTRDAAYLSLRIALLTQIFYGELPPLMMDEALCQMDDRRMKRMLTLIGKLCAERGLQCLLFTCHSREGDACQELQIPHARIIL